MVNVSNKQNSVVIKVTSSNGNTIVTAKPDLAQYWSNQSKDYAQESKNWANKLGDAVDGIEYSAKHYANLANSYVEAFEDVVNSNTNDIITTSNDYINQITETVNESISSVENKINEANELVNTGIDNINTTKNTAVSSINTTKTSAITEINNTKTTAVNAVNTSKNQALNDIEKESSSIINFKEEVQAELDEKVDIDDMVAFDMQEVPCITETYINGTSWYRVWSDGFCEQGGHIIDSANPVTVTLLKNYVNTNYSVICTQSSSTSKNGIPVVWGKATNSFKVQRFYGNYGEADWQASGYIR